MSNKTEEKLKALLEKEEQLKKEKQELKRKMKLEEKKKREKLCKNTGELTEKYFNIEHLSIEEREALFESISIHVNEKIENLFPSVQQINNISSEDENNRIVTNHSPVAL
ncbi:DNA phosphorothioation-dependent restriction protein DptG [Bacillus thuringiensis]|uniref:restriction endonuclease n=1 Tax=Bacillus thuringiensis TaxID=1428 RepID=UPI0018CFE6E3|nr:restriction endonuclease [Bacillus thuringiensis]MBG9503742.1 DNA phosphorothioation-dependent restriction protein DptG [Bacillus thuringiensis]MBG9504264.1 DNA phosphorothioation-dependent restriction protein DptG [Bacillus thuringiensis]